MSWTPPSCMRATTGCSCPCRRIDFSISRIRLMFMIRIWPSERSKSPICISLIWLCTGLVFLPVKVEAGSFLNERVRLYNQPGFCGKFAFRLCCLCICRIYAAIFTIIEEDFFCRFLLCIFALSNHKLK